jgi:hypothetical protein
MKLNPKGLILKIALLTLLISPFILTTLILVFAFSPISPFIASMRDRFYSVTIKWLETQEASEEDIDWMYNVVKSGIHFSILFWLTVLVFSIR